MISDAQQIAALLACHLSYTAQGQTEGEQHPTTYDNKVLPQVAPLGLGRPLQTTNACITSVCIVGIAAM